MFVRYLLLQIILIGVMFGVYLLGDLALVKLAIIPTVGAMICCGLVLAAMKKWELVHWVRENLPLVGLMGTVASFYISALLSGDLTVQENRDALIREGIFSLASNGLAIAGLFWLRLTGKVCGEPQDDQA